MTNSNKISRGPTIDVLKFSPGFIIDMDFVFFNVEVICEFTLTYVDICSDTSYPFGFLSRSKRPTLDILKFLVATLSNQFKKVSFVQVDEDGALERYSEFMNKCHKMNIIVQITGGDVSSLNGKIKSIDKTLANITRSLLLNSIHKHFFDNSLIIILYGPPVKMRIYCMVMFLTLYVMEKDLHTNVYKYGV